MIRSNRTDTRAWLVAVGLGLGGCNQLEKLDDDGGSGGGVEVPDEVQAAFTRSCANSPTCHAGGFSPPLDDVGALIGAPSTTAIPLLTLGDTANSYIAIKMLPDEVLAGLGIMRVGGRMPQGFDYENGLPETLADTQIILAWIGGASFESGGGGTGEDPTTGGDPTGDDTTGGEPLAPTFTNVKAEIFVKTCGCHQSAPGPANGNLSLLPDEAYANIFEVKSMQATMTNLITPADPATSYLYLKLTGEQMSVPGGSGTQMPQGPLLDETQLALVEDWILAGAMND
jgi:hypothetical protein